MSRRFFRRWLPTSAKLEQDRLLNRLTGGLLRNRVLWHLNRKSVARGVASGMWWAWIPLPLQSPFAALVAWRIKGNVPLAAAMTWVSNPITMFPAMYLCYQLGLIVTGQPGIDHFLDKMRDILGSAENAGWIAGLKKLLKFGWDNIGVLWPFWVGCVVFATFNALASYFGILWLWRWNIVRKWRGRGHHVRCRQCHHTLANEDAQECPNCGAWSPRRTRFGLGLASVARIRGRRKAMGTADVATRRDG